MAFIFGSGGTNAGIGNPSSGGGSATDYKPIPGGSGLPHGGIHGSHIVEGHYTLADKQGQQKQRFNQIPTISQIDAWLATHPWAQHWATAHGGDTGIESWFQKWGGLPVAGWSGIVPFFRTNDGQIASPLSSNKDQSFFDLFKRS